MSLITLAMAVEQASWYFEDACRDGGRWRYDIDVSFPHRVFVHNDHLFDRYSHPRGEFRVFLRRWFQRTIPADVIRSSVDCTYYYKPPDDPKDPKDPWNTRSPVEVRHGYECFHFEELADATLFRMTFPDITVSEAAKRHPDRQDIPEDWIRTQWGTRVENG